jgi:predicted RNA-binding Zn-ribbon protein involved in translation (DUF1610 family)
MSPKYRQPGYQDRREESERKPSTERRRVERDGPRSPRMPGMTRVIKCALCGTRLPLNFDEISYSSECPQCGADLHSCKNCVFFNPTSRFECEQPIKERIAPKDKRANCEFFEIRSTVEKEVTSSRQGPVDARKAFEDLFKS